MLQNPQERNQAEQALKVFGLSPDYITHCKVGIFFVDYCYFIKCLWFVSSMIVWAKDS